MELDLIEEYRTQKNQIMRPKMLAVSIDGLVESSMPLAEEVAFWLVTFAPNNISDIVVLQWGSG